MTLPAKSPSSCSLGSRDKCVTCLENEIDKQIEEVIKEEIEEENKEEIKEEIEEEIEEESELEEQRNKKIKVTDESTNEETVVETVEVATTEISDGSNIKCSHPVVEEAGSSVAFNYIHKGLRLDPLEIEKLRKDKKLILVLGMDYTLIHSISAIDLTHREKYLIHPVDEGEDNMNPTIIELTQCGRLVKLRPFVRTFLKEANKLFQMYIYTPGEQDYAREAAELLDPRCEYFPSRVICQCDDNTMNQKGLDVVLASENMVIILDETEHVWPKHKENLILMKRYYYFAYGAKLFKTGCESLSVELNDEKESDGTLASILNVLQRAHKLYFDLVNTIGLPTRDVRKILQLIKMEILQDCNIVFSKVFPSGVWPEQQALWKSAGDMGARCLNNSRFDALNDSVTHVVAGVPITGEVEWARENNKFVVTPQWIEEANYLWKRQKEEDFPVLDENDQ